MADRQRLRLVHDVPPRKPREATVTESLLAAELNDWRKVAMECAALAASVVRDDDDSLVTTYKHVARELLDGYLEVYERWEIGE